MTHQTFWLLEWKATKHLPVRYFAAGEPMPVLDATDATRFCRKKDAMEVGKLLHFSPTENRDLNNPHPVEHALLELIES